MKATDPIAIVDSLDPDDIRERLRDLDRQADALRVLLRSAVARRAAAERHRPEPPGAPE